MHHRDKAASNYMKNSKSSVKKLQVSYRKKKNNKKLSFVLRFETENCGHAMCSCS